MKNNNFWGTYMVRCLTLLILVSGFIAGDILAVGPPPKTIPRGDQAGKEPELIDFSAHYARFFADNPDLILWGSPDGLKLLTLSGKAVLEEILTGKKVTAMAVNPHTPTQAMVATNDGNVWNVEYDGKKLRKSLIEPLSKGALVIVRSILFHPDFKEKIAVANYQKIVFSEDGGITWDLLNLLTCKDEDHSLIIRIINDPDSRYHLLVSSLKKSRFRVDWRDRNCETIPEDAISHGYKIMQNAESYILIGGNSKVFSFKMLSLQVLDITKHPIHKRKYFLAGIGKSPMIYTKNKNSIKLSYLNLRMPLTYTIDSHRKNPDTIILTNSKGVHVTTDLGENWTPVL